MEVALARNTILGGYLQINYVYKHRLEVWGAAHYKVERTGKSRVIVYKDTTSTSVDTMSIVYKHKLEVWGTANHKVERTGKSRVIVYKDTTSTSVGTISMSTSTSWKYEKRRKVMILATAHWTRSYRSRIDYTWSSLIHTNSGYQGL